MTTPKYMAASCVNWTAFTVPQLWEMVVGEGDPVTYQQVSAWRQTHDAIAEHAGRLRASRDDLVASWPPERSEAAAAFVLHTDRVLLRMKEAAAAAAVNAQALAGIAEALATAKAKLQPIYEEWLRQEKRQQEQSVVGKAVDTLTFWSHEDAWRGELRTRATEVMGSTDSQVSEHRTQMRVPPPFDFKAPVGPGPEASEQLPTNNTGEIRGPGYFGQAHPPLIDPPVQPQSSAGDPPSIWRLESSRESTEGPALSGGPSAPTTPTTHGPSAAGAPAPGLPPAGSATGTPGIIGGIPSGSKERAPTSIGPTGRARTLPIIGGTGIIGSAPTIVGGTGNGNSPRQGTRVGPVGGVIGGGITSSAANAKSAIGRRSGKRENYFEPDQPWTVAEGVPAVLAPAQEPTEHTPGRGVIGVDR